MSRLITNCQQLEDFLISKNLTLDQCGLGYLKEFKHPYSLKLSEYYGNLIDWTDQNDPLRHIAIPDPREHTIQPYELTDPIGDQAREAVPGLIHRYPDRCLLLLTTHCRIHCRFCFRREVVGRGRPVDWEAIKKYLAEHTEIHEIILSGGDPGTFPAEFLRQLHTQLKELSHIKRLRLHTRIPAIDPDHLQPEWFAALAQIKASGWQPVVVIHVDHSREVTASLQQVAHQLHQAGVLLLSQSVLLQNVNNSLEQLSSLFTALVDAGIKPYYLHHPDKVVGTSHFRISIADGLELYRNLRNTLSSICLPEYVLDLPGGWGKIPVSWLTQLDEHTYEAVTFEGKRVKYYECGK